MLLHLVIVLQRAAQDIRERLDSDAREPEREPFVQLPRRKTCICAVASDSVHDARVFYAHLLYLLPDLHGALIVAERSDSVGPAGRDAVDFLALSLVLPGDLFHSQVSGVLAGTCFDVVNKINVASEDAVEDQVCRDLAWILVRRDDGTLETVFCRHRRGQASVIRLRAALGDQHGRALVESVLQQVFEFAELVASRRQVSQVVSLKVEVNA